MKSSIRFCELYCFVMIDWKKVQPATYAPRRVRVCLPEPPTPTSSAEPRGVRMMRQMRMKCIRASSKSTMSTAFSL